MSVPPTTSYQSIDVTETKKLKIEMNPLLIDVILRNIFRYLSLNEILECRAVCKLWHLHGTNRLVSRIDDVLINPPVSKSNDGSILHYFFDMLKKCEFRFTNFTFRNFPIGCQETIHLFQVCGPTIKSLSLYGVSVTSAQFAALLINLPSLETLSIGELPRDVIKNAIFSGNESPELGLKKLVLHLEYTRVSYDRSFLRDLFKSSKQLISLEIHSNYDSGFAERNIIETLIAEGSALTVKELQLSSIDDRILELLDTHLKSSGLTKFTMGHSILDGLEEDHFTKFLCAHRDTWEQIKFGINAYPHVLRFPQMKQLKFLSIGSNYPKLLSRNESLTFGTLDWGRQFPNLVTVHLYDTGSQYKRERQFNLEELFPDGAMPIATVKNLELPPELSCEFLRRIGKTFPNVLKLNLRSPQPCEVLSELWITWPLIRTLAISIFEYQKSWTNIDSIFTGVSEDVLKKWKKSNRKLDVEPFRTKPSISLLKHLRHLIINDGRRLGEFQSCEWRPTITNATVLLSLSELPELVCLNIPKSLNEITVHNVGQLQKRSCPITTYFTKYEWQEEHSTLFLFETFPHYC